MPGRRVRLRSVLWLGLILAGPIALSDSASGQERSSREQDAGKASVKTIYYRSRKFRIPVTIPEEARSMVREVRLWVSDDFGGHWKPLGHTIPDRPEFPFQSSRDGEFWFAIQTVDLDGKVYPADDRPVEPSLKIVIDTASPTIVLESIGRKGGQAEVRWELQDENLVLRSFLLEYQPVGAGMDDWRTVPLQDEDARLAGTKSWDAGTSEAIRVRATVTDRARNKRSVETVLEEGVASRPSNSSRRREGADAPPPVAPISSRRETTHDSFAEPDPFDADRRGREPRNDYRNSEADDVSDGSTGSNPRQRDQTLLVGNPRFPLQYEVEGAGPGGVAKVQLWVTHDGGRSWFPQPEDSDRTSPYLVDLKGEGTFGLWLSVQGGSGLGDPAPAPGDKPQSWVEVDSTPPLVQIDPPRIGTGASAGKVLVTWRASDPHLAPRPVVLSYRAEGTEGEWTRIAGPLENTGQYVWVVPPGVPPKFRIQIEVLDSVGHRGVAETPAVVVDRAKPKGRILGLDPGSTRASAEETRR